MRETRIIFGTGGPTLDFVTEARDFECNVQDALVNVGTDAGSDPVYPDRGTSLKKDGAQGRMLNSAWASQSANFAALYTLSFIQQTESENNAFKLTQFLLRCQSVVNQTAQLEVQAVCSDGTTIGVVANL